MMDIERCAAASEKSTCLGRKVHKKETWDAGGFVRDGLEYL